MATANPSISVSSGRTSAHLSLYRLDHSIKQVFVIPGIVIAASLTGTHFSLALFYRCLLGLSAVVAVASSNYVLNEVLDAPFDQVHPTKCSRPAARGQIHYPLAYLQWLVTGVIGFLLANQVSKPLLLSAMSLSVMGCLYNIPPIRMKDIPYLDVLAESINNPIRLCVGWYIVTSNMIPPLSLLVAYWMLGAFFMALKRFSEYRQIGCGPAMRYRRCFEFYNEQALLTSITFYAAAAMLFFGAFMMRYRIEMVFSFPMIALLMAFYFRLSFAPDSPVQHPEKLYREPVLVILVAACSTVLIISWFVHLPWLTQIFCRSSVN